MVANRHDKLQEALRETAAEFLAREAGRESLITVTHAMLTQDGHRGIIYITVLPDSDEAPALAFANRNRGEFSEYFRKHVKGASMPHVEFVIDKGEKNRQRLDEITS